VKIDAIRMHYDLLIVVIEQEIGILFKLISHYGKKGTTTVF